MKETRREGLTDGQSLVGLGEGVQSEWGDDLEMLFC